MLMMDVAFYGMGLADILSGNYSCKSKGTIQAFCPVNTLSHVHRLLQFHGGRKNLLTSDTYFIKSILCVYTFDQLNLDIELRFENPPIVNSIPKSFANVGNLYITRSGLQCLNEAEECTPFTDILRDCLARTCRIDDTFVLQPNLYTNIRNLIRNKWTVKNLKLTVVVYGKSSEKCPICHDILSGKVVRTECQHDFCIQCWEKYWQNETRPVEANSAAFRFNLRSCPNCINCPLCRTEYKPWEVCPLNVD